jgi:hypothetical protein
LCNDACSPNPGDIDHPVNTSEGFDGLLLASVSSVRNITFLRWVCSYLFDSKGATIRSFSNICAEEGSSHMKSQYGSSSQTAAPAIEYLGVGRLLLAPIIDGI